MGVRSIALLYGIESDSRCTVLEVIHAGSPQTTQIEPVICGDRAAADSVRDRSPHIGRSRFARSSARSSRRAHRFSERPGGRRKIPSQPPCPTNNIRFRITAGNLLRPTRPLIGVYESQASQTSNPSSGSQQHCYASVPTTPDREPRNARMPETSMTVVATTAAGFQAKNVQTTTTMSAHITSTTAMNRPNWMALFVS